MLQRKCDVCLKVLGSKFFVVKIWDKGYATKLGSKAIKSLDLCAKCTKDIAGEVEEETK